ncbi:hypothetical protein [Streptomyces chryseus]
MSTEPDSVAGISAPNTGPDPRTSYRLDNPAPDAGPESRNSQPADQILQVPAANGPTDVGDWDPAPGTNPAPGFDHNGIQAMSAGTGPGGATGGSSTPAAQAGGAEDHGYGVSNAELGKMADELDLAAQILEKADKGLAESDATARIHTMLTSGRMLKATTSDWDDEITRLAKQCRSLADKMRQTHTNYTAQEHRTAQDFQAILASLEGDA